MSPGRGACFDQRTPLYYTRSTPLDLPWILEFMNRLEETSYHPPNMMVRHCLEKESAITIAEQAREIMDALPNMVSVTVIGSNILHVVGDLHGHLHDLIAILRRCGWPGGDTTYIFDGDFVDRGSWGVETVLLLCILKIKWPQHVHLIRGNHETNFAATRYGFRSEATEKYDEPTYRAFLTALVRCPLAALVRTLPKTSFASQDTGRDWWQTELGAGERRTLIVHGGIFVNRTRDPNPPAGQYGHVWIPGTERTGTLERLMSINRCTMNLVEDVGADVIWSDPQIANEGITKSREGDRGLLYGPKAVREFFKQNHITGMIRAHESPQGRAARKEMGSLEKGWCVDMEFENGEFVCTVFSASDYPMRKPGGNQGAIATIKAQAFGLPAFTSLPIAARPKICKIYKRWKFEKEKRTTSRKEEESDRPSG